jgi:hypothetical protein
MVIIVWVRLLSQLRRKTNLELSRKKLREGFLTRVKYIKTCVLARELCLLVRTNRAVLNPKDVHDTCLYISGLCKEHGCEEPSELCRKAAEAVLTDEKEYLEICTQSCMKCGEARKPRPKKSTYVA